MVLRNAVFVDACTSQLVINYRKRFKLQNISMVDNAVNTERYYVKDKIESRVKCGLNQFGRIVGYCGGFPSQRGARQLIQIAGRLIDAYDDCGFLIVGNDSELNVLKKSVKRDRLEDRVIFTGTVQYEKMPDYINCLDVGIALDKPEKVKFVGNSSQKIRQYLACGVPVICPQGTNDEMIRKGLCMPVLVNDLDAIYQSISYWFRLSNSEIEHFRETARKYAIEALSSHVVYEKRYQFWKIAFKNKSFS
jgi:glycosyltransferase involved in cell wall biosynthesis